MRPLGKTNALEKLHAIKTGFAESIRAAYEHRAKSCATCETPGACCLDAHFVNVNITRLEAAAIDLVIDELPEIQRIQVRDRIDRAIEKYDLRADDASSKTYACPLFEKGIGCLVHERGQPLPCIAHACYENREDLPPDELIAEQEVLVSRLNEAVYRTPTIWRSLPVAIAEARTK
jgi:hypothetical protein